MKFMNNDRVTEVTSYDKKYCNDEMIHLRLNMGIIVKKKWTEKNNNNFGGQKPKSKKINITNKTISIGCVKAQFRKK